MTSEPYIVNKPFWQSKKFGAMVLGIVIPLIKHFLGWSLDPEMIIGFYFMIVTYIGGQSFVDAKH